MSEQHKVGDTVYGSFGRYSTIDVREGTVLKVTPSGRINVDFGFVNHGNQSPRIIQFKGRHQIGGDRFHSYYLIDRETFQRLSAEQAVQDALGKVNNLIAKTRAFKDKASLKEFIDQLDVMFDAVPGADQ